MICPACGSNDIERIDDAGYRIVYRCKKCGKIVKTEPR